MKITTSMTFWEDKSEKNLAIDSNYVLFLLLAFAIT
jgi:preprotein translocase subunit Sec61beta